MAAKDVKEKRGTPVWNTRAFTKPNGVFEASRDQKVFVPRALPPSIPYDGELIALLTGAERNVGELKGNGTKLKNPHILIRAYLRREAVLSSKIEGTLASLKDLNIHEAVGGIEKKAAEHMRLVEVENYVRALEESLESIGRAGQRVDMNMVKAAHGTLMKGVRGGEKMPGEFRRRQNWIVETQRTRQRIVYAPPPPEKIPELLRNLETFLQTDYEQTSPLIQCAVAHYQFEAIHPFLDGNGRVGRLLIPLILYKKGIMPQPLLYLSAYFDKHRRAYYNGLLGVSQKSDWQEWIKFFLRALMEQAEETIRNIKGLEDIQERYKKRLVDKRSGINAVLLMEQLFANPYITIPAASRFLKVTYPTARSVVAKLADAGILELADVSYSSKVFLAGEIEAALSPD